MPYYNSLDEVTSVRERAASGVWQTLNAVIRDASGQRVLTKRSDGTYLVQLGAFEEKGSEQPEPPNGARNSAWRPV